MSAFHLQLSPAVAAAVSQTFPSPSAPAVSWLSPACSDNGIMLLFGLKHIVFTAVYLKVITEM